MKEILIYCHNKGPRLEYVSDFIFRESLGIPVKFTSRVIDLPNHEFAINYSLEEIRSVFQIVPFGLLEETGIRKQNIPVIHENDLPFLCPVKGPDLFFDPFSAIFYLLSRYEEYLPSEKDKYGRFKASNSIAGKNNFLNLPVVNIWIKVLLKKFTSFYPGIHFKEPEKAFIPTIDIDNPWAFLNKSFYRRIGGASKDFISLNYNRLAYRLSVLRKTSQDPYDAYEYILKAHPETLKIFYLMGNRSRHDNKISSRNPAWNELVKKLSEHFETGLHPSYHSHKKNKLILKEKRILERISQKKIRISRQHFLRFSLPVTFRNLIKAGISEEYSMGYPETTGFRAGTSLPFLFYDLEKEKVSGLRIIPFTVMDRTLKDYLHLSPGQAKQTILEMVMTIKKFGGNFVSVWHNESLGLSEEWEGWKEVYDYLLQKGNELNTMN